MWLEEEAGRFFFFCQETASSALDWVRSTVLKGPRGAPGCAGDLAEIFFFFFFGDCVWPFFMATWAQSMLDEYPLCDFIISVHLMVEGIMKRPRQSTTAILWSNGLDVV